MKQLFSKETQSIIYGKQLKAVQRMLDFDYISQRKIPSIACIIDPNGSGIETAFFGNEEIIIPIYNTISDAAKHHPGATVMINFASYRSAFETTVQALDISTIKLIAVIAEGIPERKERIMGALAKEKGKIIIGPATVGGIAAGKFRIGNAGGSVENLIASKLYRSESVGLVTKSGGMLNEMFNIIARTADGINEGIAIGGDRYPCSSLIDHILRHEENEEIKFHVILGEVGGKEEYKIVEALRDGKIKKPLIAWVTGTCAKIFPTEVQFGHAGARAGGEQETADAKNIALKEAGAIVPDSFDGLFDKIKEIYNNLKSQGITGKIKDLTPPNIPIDYKEAIKEGIVRHHKEFITTISDDRGEEVKYAGIPLSQIIEEEKSIGDIIGLLWLKKKLPEYATKFIELVIEIVADHGPCVSGAHNAIVAARAGKDLVSALASGMLTIGPRFGGAIDGAGHYFKWAKDNELTPKKFVDEMKKKSTPIPGIGHRIKSIRNPDKRVELLKKYAKTYFPKTEYLDYALEVEKITTTKKENLILNVDGCTGVLLVDLMKSIGFTNEEIEKRINAGVLNAFFVLGRSIGIIGHIIDQKLLKTKLYRTPYEDVLYTLPKEKEL
ncbi:MAG: citrate/2-methylcitrate synthase [Caldisericota bacterium]|nr:citrate/2-methylcitrate synthase [Caldisericota bacterium]